MAAEAADKALWPKALSEQIEATPEQVARQYNSDRAALVKPPAGKPQRHGVRPALSKGGRFARLSLSRIAASRTLGAAAGAVERTGAGAAGQPRAQLPAVASGPDPRAGQRLGLPCRLDAHAPPQDAPATP